MQATITIMQGLPDKNYRTLVLLQRTDRPKYWTFHCVNCRMPVAHLVNKEIKAITDFYNPQDTSNEAVEVRCSSCKRFYSFQLN